MSSCFDYPVYPILGLHGFLGQIVSLTLAQEASPIPGPQEAQTSTKKSPMKATPAKPKEAKTITTQEPAKQRKSKPNREADLGMGV